MANTAVQGMLRDKASSSDKAQPHPGSRTPKVGRIRSGGLLLLRHTSTSNSPLGKSKAGFIQQPAFVVGACWP